MAAVKATDNRNRRQRRLYTYVCNLYRPKPLTAGTDLEATDAGANYEVAFTNVFGLYKSTPEYDVEGLAGRGKELNLMTSDEWRFTADQEIADQWVIHLIGSDPRRRAHPNIGRLWLVHDNPQTVAAQGNRDTNVIMVYAVMSNLPGLSTLVEGLA